VRVSPDGLILIRIHRVGEERSHANGGPCA
jgi:hypothetical protein